MFDSRILTAAKRDLAAGVQRSLMLPAIVAIVFGINWKYLYNFAAGPFSFRLQGGGLESLEFRRPPIDPGAEGAEQQRVHRTTGDFCRKLGTHDAEQEKNPGKQIPQ